MPLKTRPRTSLGQGDSSSQYAASGSPWLERSKIHRRDDNRQLAKIETTVAPPLPQKLGDEHSHGANMDNFEGKTAFIDTSLDSWSSEVSSLTDSAFEIDYPTLEAAPLIVKPRHSADTTVHMSLPTTFDVEDALEECSRLRRMGHFKIALEKYENEIGMFLDNRYILVQYGQCLLEAGQHRRLAELSTAMQFDPNPDPLQLNWILILLSAGIMKPSTDKLSIIRNNISSMLEGNWDRLDSTEIHVIILAMAINCGPDSVRGFVNNWKGLFEHLIEESMIWEFNDVFVQLACIMGTEYTWCRIWPHLHTMNDRLERLHMTWDTQEPDESTASCLLDFMTSLSLLYLKPVDKKSEARRCLQKAAEHAKKLSLLRQGNTKTRPFLRYLMVDSFIEYSEERCPLRRPDASSGSGKEGTIVYPKGLFPAEELPVYIPTAYEIPIWATVSERNRENTIAKVQTVFLAALDLGDLEMQTASLKELLYRGTLEPQSLIDSLEGLWVASGNTLQRRTMHLFQYAIAHTPEDREKVRRTILLDGELIDDTLGDARNQIMRALSTTEAEREYYTQLSTHLHTHRPYIEPSSRMHKGHRNAKESKSKNQAPATSSGPRPRSRVNVAFMEDYDEDSSLNGDDKALTLAVQPRRDKQPTGSSVFHYLENEVEDNLSWSDGDQKVSVPESLQVELSGETGSYGFDSVASDGERYRRHKIQDDALIMNEDALKRENEGRHKQGEEGDVEKEFENDNEGGEEENVADGKKKNKNADSRQPTVEEEIDD